MKKSFVGHPYLSVDLIENVAVVYTFLYISFEGLIIDMLMLFEYLNHIAINLIFLSFIASFVLKH